MARVIQTQGQKTGKQIPNADRLKAQGGKGGKKAKKGKRKSGYSSY